MLGTIVPALLAASAVSATPPFFRGLGIPPGEPFNFSQTLGIAADGRTVIGTAFGLVPRNIEWGFAWTEQTGMRPLAWPPPPYFDAVFPLGVSADGTAIAGWYNPGEAIEAYRLTAAGLGPAARCENQYQSRAWGISGDGRFIVGAVQCYHDGTPYGGPFRWTPGAPPELLDPAGALRGSALAASFDGSVVIGSAEVAGMRFSAPFRWTPQSGVAFIGPSGSACAVTPDGRVVVGTITNAPGNRAFRWTAESGAQLLPLPTGAIGSTGVGVTADGSVVTGSVGYGGEVYRSVQWDGAQSPHDIRELLESAGVRNLPPLRIGLSRISADGVVLAGNVADEFGGQFQACIASLGTPCRPDYTGDGRADIQDFLGFLEAFGRGSMYADFDSDGVINVSDFLAFLASYAAGC
jgi:uncharacterized membrane protein